MTTPTVYAPLAQLAATFRQLRLSATADLVDREHELLAERYGPLKDFSMSGGSAIPPWLLQFRDTLVMHRGYCERMGNIGGALGHALGVTILARALQERVPLTPLHAQRFVEAVRAETAKAFERIEGSKVNEAGTAAFLRNQSWQQARRETLDKQARDQKIAELTATKARLEAALSE